MKCNMFIQFAENSGNRMLKSGSMLFQLLFLLLCIGSVFTYSQLFTDYYIVSKWLFSLFLILIMILLGSIKIMLYGFMKNSFIISGVIVSLVCFIQAVYGLIQFISLPSSSFVNEVTGTFENPAGFAACLCAGLPFIGCFMLNDTSWYFKCIGKIVGAIIVIAIIISYSRAGIVSIVISGGVYLSTRLSQRWLVKIFLWGSLIVVIAGCYYIKKDSADGRLLIWLCSINMMKDAPLLGHGIGSFEAHYMDYQAEYFKHHEQSRFYMLADNIKQPFNEYLNILLNFGFVGLLVLLILIGAIVYCYQKNPNVEKKMALYSLISIGIFSLFSYPFTYPLVWIVTFLSVFMIIGGHIKNFISRVWIKNIVCISVFICSLLGVYKLVERTQAELEWGRISKLTLSDSYDTVLPAYEKLEKTFADNPYFLYNYAAVLLEKKQYDKSLEIALQCRKYWADYDLELILGENYQKLNKPKLAEKYYNSASMMCPSRFLPLYKLFHLYKMNGEKERSLAMAETVVDKPMKIETAAIKIMKREMEREIQKMNMSIKRVTE